MRGASQAKKSVARPADDEGAVVAASPTEALAAVVVGGSSLVDNLDYDENETLQAPPLQAP